MGHQDDKGAQKKAPHLVVNQVAIQPIVLATTPKTGPQSPSTPPKGPGAKK
jgi:hypothetical protein